jgi:hypothetical protein
MQAPRATAVAAFLWALFLAVYLPQAGHGFIQDDFRWIVESRIQALSDVVRVFNANVGFYRPLVSLTFAFDYWLWGLNAFGYALTNIALCLLASALLYLLVRRLGLSHAAAVVAMAVWLFNFHGVNMAVLWLSGRTALLAAVFLLLCAHAVVSGRYLTAGALTLAATMSKEEAVVVPLLFAVFLVMSERRFGAAMKTAPMWAALAVYLFLRWHSRAFWPADAPSYYTLSFAPGLVLRNVAEYADRAATASLATALIFALGSRIRWSDVSVAERRAITCGAIWIPSMFALTIFLPVRSSLYALLPSIGCALIAGVVGGVAQRTSPRAFARVATTMTVAGVLLVPVYRERNRRWVRPAELSHQVVTTLGRDLQNSGRGRVALIDDPGQRFNLATAFGGLLPNALELHLGSGWNGDIVQATDDVSNARYVYRLMNSDLMRTR